MGALVALRESVDRRELYARRRALLPSSSCGARGFRAPVVSTGALFLSAVSAVTRARRAEMIRKDARSTM
jgi:hypothetical protein